MLKKHFSILILLFALAISNTNAQTITEKPEITQYILNNPSDLGVSSADVYDIQYVQTAVLNNNAGYVHYYNQAVGDIPIQNAMINVVEYPTGDLSIGGNRAIADIQSKLADAKYQISAAEAVSLTTKRLGTVTRSSDLKITKINDREYQVEDLAIADNTVPVKKIYVLKNGQLIPTWTMDIDMKTSADYFSIQVDGRTGDLVDVQNYTVYCNHEHSGTSHACSGHEHHGQADSDRVSVPSAAAAMIDGSAYAVYEWPIESPIHGEQSVVTEPADLEASPFGWHDVDGAEGPEYTITRGNNVHAYQDIASGNSSTGDEPDGGEDLQFIFQHNLEEEPIFSVDASITNLFYVVNKMHDFTHFYGFNEVNGNFQANNYGNGGTGNDHVNAEDLDGSGTNNANFATPPEGGNGRMQMFGWDQGGDDLFSVQSPAAIAGFIEVGLAATDPLWAFDYADSPIINGKIVLATDGNLQGGTQLCGPVDNVAEVTGNIALVDRGSCFFSEKALSAQQGGAIACVICNVEGVNGGTGEELLDMAAGEIPEPVTIPTVFMRKSDCDRIRSQMAGGNDVLVNIEEIEREGPDQFNSSFDNGVIAHEFGHGVSTRLTGGSNNSGCLFNLDTDGDGTGDTGEQMGEGWSDFYGLVTTTKEGSQGSDVRGVGTYVNGETTNGTGIRVFPYSTDMSINPQTYDDIANASVPHGVGAVWNAMIWDMYWAFVDLYGFDEDYKNTESGNYRAVKLVTDAMMIQPCRPGFVDGRDAIMEADMLNYGGEHICMIWEVFARRGLGYLADQGDSMSHTDGFENFDPLPTCIKELKVKKTATDLVQPGGEVNVEIYYANHTEETANSVVITDEIPDGMTFVSSTASVDAVVEGNIVSWDFGDVPTLQEETFSVIYSSDPEVASTRTKYDPITSSDGWEVDFLEGFNIFSIVPIFPNSGERSWWIESVETASDQVLDYTNLLVTGEKPVLRFWHAFETELRSDGGFVMISTDGGQTFAFVDDKFILNEPNTTLQFGTFAIPNLQAWSGDSEGYIGTYIDLSEYAGQEITVRFRWGSDDNTSPPLQPGSSFIPGWYIDDFELIDLKTYEAEACITSTSTEGACTGALTTIIDTGLALSSTSDIDKSGAALDVYPNPTSGDINVQLSSTDQSTDYQVSLFSMDGRQLKSTILNRGQAQHNFSLNTENLNNGMYLVQVSSQNGILTSKVVLNR